MAFMRWLIILTLTTTLQAQSAQPVNVSVAVGQFMPAARPTARLDVEAERRVNSVVPSRDYRWEGAALGAFLVGALGYRYASATCNDNSTQSCSGHNLTRIAMGALVGGVTGLFIGSSIKKSPDSAQ